MQRRVFTSVLLLALGAAAQDLTVQTSTPTDVVGTTSTDGMMSIPQGETPITTPLTNPLTDPTSVAPTIQTSNPSNPPDVSPPPEMSIPSGETPTPTIPPITITSPVPVPSNGTSTSAPNSTRTLSTSAGPSQTSPNAAVPLTAKGGGLVFSMALFGLAWLI